MKLKKIVKRIFSLWTLAILFGLLLLLLASTRLMMQPKDVTDFKDLFADNKYPPQSFYTDYNGRKIHYVSAGPDTLPLILLIHGSPGSWDALKEFIADTSISNHARVVSVDRAGYGLTGGKGLESLQEQAVSIAGILNTNKSGKKAIVVSHSYGGAVAAQLAMDHYDQIGSLILAAPAISPENQPRKWYNYAGKFFLFRWIMSPAFQASNKEMWPLKEELEKQDKRWDELQNMLITIIHGNKDVLVPFETVEFLCGKMGDSQCYKQVTVKNMNHFIPWTHTDLMATEIKVQLAELVN